MIRGRSKAALRRFPLTVLGAALLLLSLAGWWHSSRYSERHLFYLGGRTVEAFSASSLLRVSFVNGTIPKFGKRTFYRQRNARGRFLLRPVVPSFRRQPDLFEVTLGYWHLAALAGIFLAGVGVAEAMRREGSASEETR